MQPHAATSSDWQHEANRFALFIFAWHLAYQDPNETLVLPLTDDVDALARYAIRHFSSKGQGTPDTLKYFVDVAARALHTRYFYLPQRAQIAALDEIRSLIAEELGLTPEGLQLQG